MNARYLKEVNEIVSDEHSASLKRHKPITIASVKGKNLLNVLEKKVLSYPAHDLRLERAYSDTHDVSSTDSEFMKDVSHGMTLRTAGKQNNDNILTINADFHSNMGEFERYNLVVEDHNKEWMSNGCRSDTFDPIHGIISPVRDQRVGYARVDNSHDRLPEDRKKGPLSKAKPDTFRSTVISVQYRVCIDEIPQHGLIEKVFCLEYVARDSEDRVLYYNVLHHSDLNQLIRSSVQELWGNPKEYGDEGAFLEGIALLIQGKKVAYCKNTNEKPFILSGKLKSSNPELVVSKVNQTGLSGLGALFGYIIPIGACFMLFLSVPICIMLHQNQGVGNLFPWFMVGCPTVIVISNRIAARINRQNSALKMQEKFL